mgnify:CR=1 FL=1
MKFELLIKYLNILVAIAFISCSGQTRKLSDMKIEWNNLPDYPIEKGVSGHFAGIHNNVLIVAGGCNFPDTPVAEGGVKKFYDEIFVLDLQNGGGWKNGFKLPYPVAYGVSVSTENGVICIGGQNADSCVTNVTLLEWNGEDIEQKELPALPVTIDNAAAVQLGDYIYVTGGNVNGVASSNVYRLNINESNSLWEECVSFGDSKRVQPVVFALHENVCIGGGFQPVMNGQEPVIPANLLKYNQQQKYWEEFAAFPKDESGTPYCFVGGNAVNINNENVLFMCGVNYTIFLPAIRRELLMQQAVAAQNDSLITDLKQRAKEYLTQTVDWYKFNKTLLLWNAKENNFTDLGQYPQLARAGTAVVYHDRKVYVVCGELKPGIRTSEVNCMTINN